MNKTVRPAKERSSPAPGSFGCAKGPSKSEYITASEIGRFARENTRLIVGTLFISVAIGLLYLQLATPQFVARTQILIDPKTPILRDQSGEINFSLDSAQVESQIAVLRSEKIAIHVINDFDLQADAEFRGNPSLFSRWFDSSQFRRWFDSPQFSRWFDSPQSRLEQGPSTEDQDQERDFVALRNAIVSFENALSVSRVGLSYAIEVAFRSGDPKKAAKIANAVADRYLRDQIESKSESTRQGSQWLESRLAELRGQMNSATKRVQIFRANFDYRISAKDGPELSDKTTLEELEAAADTYRKVYESVLQAYTSSVQRLSYPVSDARIITVAYRPLSKSYPRTLLSLGMSVLIGLTLGCALALLRSYLRAS